MKKKIALIFLILLQCSVTVAQNYIYSVTTGTAWSRVVYPQQERMQRAAMQQGEPLPDDAPNFGKIFNQIFYTYNKSNTYNDSIFYDLSHEEWISMFKRRAVKFSQFYADDNVAIEQLKNYFRKDNVPEAAYDSLFFWTKNMYHRNINDIFLYEQFMDILLPHYEELDDIEHLVFCYMCSGLYNYQCSRMGDKTASRLSERYYHKVLDLADHFTTFTDPLNRYYFIAAYVNMTVLHTQAGNISVTESKNITNDVLQLYKSSEVQNIFKQDSLLNAFADWSYDLFRLRGITTFISQRTKNDKLRDELYASYKEIMTEIGNDFNALKNRYYAKLPYDDYLIEAYMGNITWNEAFERTKASLSADPEMELDPVKTPDLKINYLHNLFETSSYILEHANLPTEEKSASMKFMLNRILNFIEHYQHSRYPFEKGMILDNLARKADVLQYLNTQERRDLLFRLIVLEQPTTYVHVMMVAELAKKLAAYIIEQEPEFFLSLPNIGSVEDVKQQKDSLIEFINQAAIFHDLGKISMPTVVNNCIRKLNDHEFKILELHPEKSRPFFAIDPSLKPYQDIALGHHKWYNGKGYPTTFKNQQSPYYPIICLITVCDCLDAATENIGRNYHRPKPFETVLKEFLKESGTRYHPDIINFIRWNKEVQDAMKKIVNDGRYDHYYKLYSKYMSN